MNVYRLKNLCIEVFKTIKNVGPVYMKNIFEINDTKRNRREVYKNNIIVPTKNTATFGTKSITSLGPFVWNKLPAHLKNCNDLQTFKKMLTKWDGVKCLCKKCER